MKVDRRESAALLIARREQPFCTTRASALPRAQTAPDRRRHPFERLQGHLRLQIAHERLTLRKGELLQGAEQTGIACPQLGVIPFRSIAHPLAPHGEVRGGELLLRRHGRIGLLGERGDQRARVWPREIERRAVIASLQQRIARSHHQPALFLLLAVTGEAIRLPQPHRFRWRGVQRRAQHAEQREPQAARDGTGRDAVEI
jgi:hypothetical protein